MAYSGKFLGSREVDKQLCLVVHLDERSRHGIGGFFLYNLAYCGRRIFAPSHAHNSASRKNVGKTEGYGHVWHILAMVGSCNAMFAVVAQQSETATRS